MQWDVPLIHCQHTVRRLHPALRRFTRRVKEEHREGQQTVAVIAWWEIEDANTRDPNIWSEILKPTLYFYYFLLTIPVLGADVKCVSLISSCLRWKRSIWIPGASQTLHHRNPYLSCNIFPGTLPHMWCFWLHSLQNKVPKWWTNGQSGCTDNPFFFIEASSS